MSVPHDLEALRLRIADMIGDDPDQITDHETLMDLGLDSVRAMALLAEWRAAGLTFETSQFLERPTLADWAVLLAEARARGAS